MKKIFNHPQINKTLGIIEYNQISYKPLFNPKKISIFLI